jgi:hypothetical protein
MSTLFCSNCVFNTGGKAISLLQLKSVSLLDLIQPIGVIKFSMPSAGTLQNFNSVKSLRNNFIVSKSIENKTSTMTRGEFFTQVKLSEESVSRIVSEVSVLTLGQKLLVTLVYSSEYDFVTKQMNKRLIPQLVHKFDADESDSLKIQIQAEMSASEVVFVCVLGTDNTVKFRFSDKYFSKVLSLNS